MDDDRSVVRPPNRSRTFQVRSWLSLLFTLVVLWPLSVFTAMYRIEMLDQAIAFGIELPKLTQWAFYVPAATFPACATLLSIVLIVKEIVWSNKWGSLIANLIALGAIVVGYLMYWVILALPVRDMIEQLS